MTTITDRKLSNTSALKIIIVLVASIFFSSNSLAKLNHIEKMYSQEGYPYADLIRRSEKVNLIYTESENEVNCRVEISSDGRVWQGQNRVAKLKNFKNKPLHSCLTRPEAKKLLANIY
jgi:hypothetical protein